MWFIGVEVEQETSAPPSKKNPGSAPVIDVIYNFHRTLPFVKGIREVHEAKKEVFELWWNRTQHRLDKSYRCSVD